MSILRDGIRRLRASEGRAVIDSVQRGGVARIAVDRRQQGDRLRDLPPAAAQGVNVVLTARNERTGLAATEQTAGPGPQRYFPPPGGHRRGPDQRLADYIESAHGRCDILVNNAGIALDRYSVSVLDTPVPIFRDTLETNVYGPLMLCQAMVPIMMRRRYGRVVNLSSGMGQLEDMEDGSAAYRVSKTALNALTRMVAAAARKHGVLVNSLCPGWVRTDMGGRERHARGGEGGRDRGVVGHTARERADRRILSRQEADCVVAQSICLARTGNSGSLRALTARAGPRAPLDGALSARSDAY